MNSNVGIPASKGSRLAPNRGNVIKVVVAAMLAATVIMLTKWDSPLQAAVKPSVSLEQCSNAPQTCDTAHAANWQTGNLGSSDSDYAEGESVAYRSIASNLTVGKTYRINLEWDTTQSGHHALDYLTSFDRTESTADPCAGVTCVGATNTVSIPVDSHVTAGGVTQLAGQSFTAIGATFPASGSVITNSGNLCGTASCSISANPSSYSLAGAYAGTSQTSISVYFTATNSTAVIAWGGHIASRVDWGAGNSAAAVAGSPYHMRLIDLGCSDVSNCSSGNMDRSLSAAAVTLPASITVVKQATSESSTSFSFVASPSPLTNFSLVDDGTTANTQVFSGITAFGTYVVTESSLAGWGLDRVSCATSHPSTGSTTVEGSSATIVLAEGEDVVCTFYNAPLPAPSIDLAKAANAQSYSAVGDQITYTYVITNTGNTVLGPDQFTIDDNKINGGEPFNCGASETTLQIGGTVSCTAVYTITSGDIESGEVINTAFGIVGQLTTPNRQVTVTYVAPATTTTTTTTTLPVATTTTLPGATTTLPPTTTIPATTTTTPVEPQVVTPANPTGTEDVLDVLIPETLPETGWPIGGITILAAVILLFGVGAMTMSSNRRSRKDGGR